MKALTVQQPFASLIAYGEKTVEFRTWATDHRGALAICASARNVGKLDDGRTIPYGVVVATCLLKQCRPFTQADMEAACMDEMPKTEGYAWVLGAIKETHPQPIKGKQRLFEIEDMPEAIWDDSTQDHVDLFAAMSPAL